MSQITAFQPPYYKHFACAGGKCQNTCCRGWAVFFDKSECDRHLSVADEAFKKKFSESVEAVTPDPFKAKFKMDESGRCPFLKPNGLCEIHAAHGPEVLPDICQTYPRIINNVTGELESFVSLSCEAAARLALFDTGILKLTEGPAEGISRISAALEPEKYTSAANGADVFWSLRIASIYAIQNRRHPVWLRMVLLGLFSKQAGEFIAAGRESELAGVSDEFMSSIENGAFDGYAGQIPDRADIKISVIYQILDQISKYKHDKDGDLFSACVAQMKEGLGAAGGSPSAKATADSFKECCNRYYLPFFKSREHIFENYIAHTIFMSGFPFSYGNEGDIYYNYIRLAVKYSLVKFLLIGMAGCHKHNFGQKEIVDGVSAFTRAFDHRADLVNNIVKMLENLEMTSMGSLCVLLRD